MDNEKEEGPPEFGINRGHLEGNRPSAGDGMHLMATADVTCHRT